MTTSDCFEYAENPHVNQNFRDKKYWNRKFQTQTKLWTLTELVTVYTQGPGVHFCARVQVLELVLGHLTPCPNSSVGMLEKRVYSH